MKKIFSQTISPVLYLLLTPALAFAAVGDVSVTVKPPPGNQFEKLFNFDASSFGGVVGSAITILFVLATVLALGFLVYGGIKWIMSGGDKAGVEAARGTIVAAIVGLVIVFLSYFILNIVLGFFDLTLSKLVLPQLNPASTQLNPDSK